MCLFPVFVVRYRETMVGTPDCHLDQCNFFLGSQAELGMPFVGTAAFLDAGLAIGMSAQNTLGGSMEFVERLVEAARNTTLPRDDNWPEKHRF